MSDNVQLMEIRVTLLQIGSDPETSDPVAVVRLETVDTDGRSYIIQTGMLKLDDSIVATFGNANGAPMKTYLAPSHCN